MATKIIQVAPKRADLLVDIQLVKITLTDSEDIDDEGIIIHCHFR